MDLITYNLAKKYTDKAIGSGGGGEVNRINTVKVNDVALIPDASKAVNIDLTNYALTSYVNEIVGNINTILATLTTPQSNDGGND